MGLQLADRSKQRIWLNGELLFNKELPTKVYRGLEAYFVNKKLKTTLLALVDARSPENKLNTHKTCFEAILRIQITPSTTNTGANSY
jgi:hypothetical protein